MGCATRRLQGQAALPVGLWRVQYGARRALRRGFRRALRRFGGDAVAAQGVVQGAVDEVVGEAAFAEAYFVFGGVGVDVDEFGVDVEIEDENGMAVAV